MAQMESTITVKTSEYRPCFVKDRRALFHRWEDNSEIYAPSLMVGGHDGGVVKYTLAIIEYEDGHVERVKPEDVRFADNLIKQYAFPEHKETEQKGQKQEKEKRGVVTEEIQCPFCGGENKNAVVWFIEHTKEYFVCCPICEIETKDTFKAKNAAIKAFRSGENEKLYKGGDGE